MKNNERIIKYFNGRLKGKELKQFETELLINPELTELLDLLEKLMKHEKTGIRLDPRRN